MKSSINKLPNYALLVVAILGMLLACEKSSTGKTVTINNRYSLTLPRTMLKTDNLNEEASLQYMNPFTEMYAIVIDEDADEFHKVVIDNELEEYYSQDLEGYTKLLLNGFEESIAMKDIEVKDTTIHFMKAKVVEMEGRVDNLDIYYLIAYFQGAKTYYQLFTWTMLKRKRANKKTMEKIVYSFKEL